MAKRERSRLVMADDIAVTDLQSLIEHFDWEKSLQYYKTGELVKWLRRLYYDEEADALEKLDSRSADFPKDFCALFGIEYKSDKPYIPPINPRTRSNAGQRRKAPTPPPRPVAMPKIGSPAMPPSTVAPATESGTNDEMGFDFSTEAFSDEVLGEEAVYTSPQGETPEELYEKGEDAESRNDYVAALEYYRKAADFGNAKAMNNVGMLYYNGTGVIQDYQEAMNWFKKAADLGRPAATYNIGALHEYGQGVSQNYQEALNWYQKAAELGSENAMYRIGELYYYGCGVTQNYQEAMNWYKKAADLGYASAMYSIGSLYQEGYGITQNYQEAMNWYIKAANLGNVEAMKNIGSLYDNMENYQEALHWYKKAAELGSSGAMNNIGFLYRRGQGVTQNYQEAKKWYEKAAALGNKAAMCNIGYLYKNGQGVTQNYQEALNWYTKAYEAGDKDALKQIEALKKKIDSSSSITKMFRNFFN